MISLWMQNDSLEIKKYCKNALAIRFHKCSLDSVEVEITWAKRIAMMPAQWLRATQLNSPMPNYLNLNASRILER